MVDVAVSIAGNLGNQFRDQLGLGGEVAVDRARRDIGPDRDRRDLNRRHPAFRRSLPRRREDRTAPGRKALNHLMRPPINHGALPVPHASRTPCGRTLRR